jgi:hypothetical protein
MACRQGSISRQRESAIVSPTYSYNSTPTLVPTKWWIKTPALLSTEPTIASSIQPNTVTPVPCPEGFTSALGPDFYAYVSHTPPLPNRIRSGPSLSSDYIGELEPGEVMKIVAGPVCSEGHSWWLIESHEKGVRGWSAAGTSSEQWIIPCPDKSIVCSQLAFNLPIPTSYPSSTQNNSGEDDCQGRKLTVGMLARVKQDSLLVVRAEPFTGEMAGRAGPLSILRIVGGPVCSGGQVWWELDVLEENIRGWSIEEELEPCPRDDECVFTPL